MKMDKNLIFRQVFLTQNPVNILSRSATATEYVLSLVLIDIHSQVFMPHGYTDDTPHGYRKSFGLIGKVKRILLKGWHSILT